VAPSNAFFNLKFLVMIMKIIFRNIMKTNFLIKNNIFSDYFLRNPSAGPARGDP
jgi:hypothetical protein